MSNFTAFTSQRGRDGNLEIVLSYGFAGTEVTTERVKRLFTDKLRDHASALASEAAIIMRTEHESNLVEMRQAMDAISDPAQRQRLADTFGLADEGRATL